MSTLLEIGEELGRLNHLLELSDGEITDEVSAEIDKALGDLATKGDGYAALIRERELRADAREAESKRLADLVATDRNTARSLRDRLKYVMETTGQTKIETERYRLTICRNGGKTPLDVHEPAERLPSEYRLVEYKPNTDAIRAELESGASLPFATLQERGHHLRIK